MIVQQIVNTLHHYKTPLLNISYNLISSTYLALWIHNKSKLKNYEKYLKTPNNFSKTFYSNGIAGTITPGVDESKNKKNTINAPDLR